MSASAESETGPAPANSGRPPAVCIRAILVPVDFSPESINALRYAVGYAECFDAKIRLVHVIEAVAMPPPELLTTPPIVEIQPLIEAAGERMQSDEVMGLVPEDHRGGWAVRAGTPWSEIIDECTEQNCDLIVIPTHGRTGLKQLFMGSTAEKIVRHAKCPVLVLRENTPVVPDEAEKA